MDVRKVFLSTSLSHSLIEKNDRILVALSGGADSTTLLMLLDSIKEEYNLTIAAAHINHKLRDTADRDMEFCRALCKKLGIEFFCLCADVHSDAKKSGMSEELYARNLRYSYFESLGYDKIATAHNKNDNAETILFRFIRGTGIDGLSGIPYRRDNIIRPILDIEKKDIIKFCSENNIEYVTDETNFRQIYSRNKLRLSLIPEIERDFNPGFSDVITRNAPIISEDSKFLDSLARKEYNGKIIISDFLQFANPIKRRIIQLHYQNAASTGENISSKYINDIIALINKGKSGSRINLPGCIEALIEYDELKIRKVKEKIIFKYRMYPEKLLKIPEIGKNIIIRKCENGEIHLDNTDDLYIRSRCTGDYFYPVGMTGKKKLSDFFTDKKIPPSKRDIIPILTQGNDIISIIGMRNDRRFCDKSKTAYTIEIKEGEDAE